MQVGPQSEGPGKVTAMQGFQTIVPDLRDEPGTRFLPNTLSKGCPAGQMRALTFYPAGHSGAATGLCSNPDHVARRIKTEVPDRLFHGKIRFASRLIQARLGDFDILQMQGVANVQ